MNRKVSSEGSIIFWDSVRLKRSDAQDAFDAEGVGHLIPKVDFMACMTHVTRQVVDACGLHDKGGLRYFPLQTDKDAVGLEVRQLVKGKSRNNLPYLFSVGVVDNGGHAVAVLDVDQVACPDVATNISLIENAATALWHESVEYLTADGLTQAIVALVKRQHGVLLRQGGGVYFVTADKAQPYANISAALAPHGPGLHMTEFDPVVNPRLIDHVCRRVKETLDETAEELLADAADLQARNAKPRRNGQRTRLQRLIDAEALAEHMKKSFGVAFTSSCKALQQAREAIGTEGIRMMRTSA